MWELAAGSEIDRYRVEVPEPGGPSEVWRVSHLTLGTQHRLEVGRPVSPSDRDRLIAAWQLQATLRHPRLARVWDIVEHDALIAVVTERIDGPSLHTLLEDARPTSHVVALIARGIVEGLACAHAAGLTHGELTAHSVLLAPEPGGRVPVITGFTGLGDVGSDLRDVGRLLQLLSPLEEAQDGLTRCIALCRQSESTCDGLLRLLDADLPGPTALLVPGAACGNYVVEGLLGQGGTADVYRVRHAALDTWYAMKVPRVGMDRTWTEGRALSQLVHPHIVSVNDLVDVGGRPGIVMELVEGPTLKEFLGRGPLPSTEADRIADMLLAAVAHAHRAGWVHRDLKPENVLMKTAHQGAVVKVADFGLAKLLRAAPDTRTRTGEMLGTPGYMAPEQIRDARSADERSDVFSLGAILYELLAGQPAFRGDNVLQTLTGVSAGRYQALETTIPERMRLTIAAALQADPLKRPRDAAALHAMWRTPVPIARPRWLVPALAAITAIVVSGGVMGVRPDAAPPEASAPSPAATSEAVDSGLPEPVVLEEPPPVVAPPPASPPRRMPAEDVEPEPPPPEPQGRIVVYGEHTDARLRSGERTVPLGDVPVGTWTLEVSFHGEPMAPLLTVSIDAGEHRAIHCEAALRVCR